MRTCVITLVVYPNLLNVDPTSALFKGHRKRIVLKEQFRFILTAAPVRLSQEQEVLFQIWKRIYKQRVNVVKDVWISLGDLDYDSQFPFLKKFSEASEVAGPVRFRTGHDDLLAAEVSQDSLLEPSESVVPCDQVAERLDRAVQIPKLL